ncbi:hypothetical protein N7466_006234 [Penicillium verhagenii]|uniref:uncharacterized protein n=1 Tax=Penicillium verhagenii TaxID=1562060 RepID=UPI00254500C7|nr:uncharacterized protein N7466_006234 [Penicillium verhagenii]KAJ5930741.1 hypothetical protein N7466_006234 [Penicillium verhagenii]
MAPRTKRRHLTDLSEDQSDEICRPATQSQKDSWNGFCEIESEPALFNVMLREFGVRGVKIQEVVSLDQEMMAFLKYDLGLKNVLFFFYFPLRPLPCLANQIWGSKPIYGLIFLFRWQEDDTDQQEPSCPDGLWFANQTASNACASVALLNIVNNIPDIDLGENLQHFKEFTKTFTPALRGDAINNFEFVKRVHNTFARKMDILNADLQLKTEATSKKRHKGQDTNDSDGSFHFIAFMPVMGQVWKFDGLERQPQSLGECSEDDWLEVARPNILDRMAAYEEDQIEFSILGVVRDPLHDLIRQLAINVRSLQMLNARLTSSATPVLPDGITSLSEFKETVLDSDLSYGLGHEEIDAAVVPEMTSSEASPGFAAELEELREAQGELRVRIREEQQSQRIDEDHARGRRYDYGPALRTWLRFLARKQVLAELV